MKGNLKDYSFENLLFKLGLYQKVSINTNNFTKKITQTPWGYHQDYMNVHEWHYSDDFKHLVDFLNWEGKFFGYCPNCKRNNSLEPYRFGFELDEENEFSESLLESVNEDQLEHRDISMAEITMKIRVVMLLKYKTYTKVVKCTHDPNHEFIFIYKLKLDKVKNELEFQKIGQSPSLSEFTRPEIDNYKKIMKKLECHEDFLKASNMNATGMAIAAYTYLRRVFEKVINRVFKDNQEGIGKGEKEFKDMQMKQKINLLKEFLPTFLTDNNSNIYGLLSAGIHELDEKEASAMFPVLETAILIVFKQIQDKIDNQLLEQRTKNALNNFATEIKS
ncbi:hypothetical protein ACWIE6_29535 [Paenibacillus taichungensis]